MARITVISRRATAYGPARQPVEVELTPRIEQLLELGVFYRPYTEVKPRKKAATKGKAPEPVTGVTAAPAGEEAVTSDPIDHEGAST